MGTYFKGWLIFRMQNESVDRLDLCYGHNIPAKASMNNEGLFVHNVSNWKRHECPVERSIDLIVAVIWNPSFMHYHVNLVVIKILGATLLHKPIPRINSICLMISTIQIHVIVSEKFQSEENNNNLHTPEWKKFVIPGKYGLTSIECLPRSTKSPLNRYLFFAVGNPCVLSM